MASSGKITAHNLHLLQDGPEDAPGDEEQGSSIMPDDDLNLQTADSPSSVDSRRIDESPVDDPSPANLTEEARYQEELKERVKKSFADLGIEPEGVLLKDSLEDTPRDIAIQDDLPYEGAPQGEYDARRKKSKSDNVNEDDIDSDDAVDDDRNGFEGAQEQSNDEASAVNDDIDDDGDNFLADSLEADAAPHHEHPESAPGFENVPLHPNDNNIPDNYNDPQDSGARDDYDREDRADNDFVRDSLETDRADSELQDLKASNPKSFGDTTEDHFDGDASDSFPTPVNQNIPKDNEEQEDFPQLSKPFRLDDGNNLENENLTKDGEDPIESNHEGDEIDNDVGETDNLRALTEQVYDDSNDRTFSVDDKLDDGYENEAYGTSGPQNDAPSDVGAQEVTPSEHDDDQEQSDPLTEGSAPLGSGGDQFDNGYPDDDVVSADKQPALNDSRLSDSRGHPQSPATAMPGNSNNNANGPYDRPPSGGSVRSFRSNLNSRQRDPTGVPSPGNPTSAEDRPITRNLSSSGSRTPVRSRENSRERKISARSRQTPTDRSNHTPVDRARQTPTDRDSPATSRPPSGNRRGSSGSKSGSPKEQVSRNSRNSNSREGKNSRRGSNDISIPKYSRKGMNNSDGDDGSSREDLPNGESRDQRMRSGSGKAERVPSGSGKVRKAETVTDPHHSPSSLKPPPGPPKLNIASANDPRSHGQPDSTGSKPSPRDFMTPGQRMEVEEDKQFWSEMHQAGVFPQPVNPNPPAKAKTQTQDQVKKLHSGEKVRVQYISDDSGDEDLHFVDEKGSPIDQLGRPLFSAKTPETPDMKILYRIKPSPPRQKSNRKSPSGRHRTRDLSAADSSRYGSGYSTRNGSGVGSGREGSRIPVKKLVDRQVSPIEDEISPEESQQEGVLEGTLPPEPVQQEQPRERPVKSACFQTGIDDLPSPEEPPEDIQESDFKSPVQETGIQTVARETPVQATEGTITGNNDNTLPYHSQNQSPRHTREEVPFGQVRVAPYQQQPQQSPRFQQLPPGYNPQGQMPFPAGAYAQPIPGNYHGNPQAHWQPVGGQPGYPNQSQQFAAPLQPQFVNPLISPGGNQQIPQQMMQNYPNPGYHPQAQDPMQQLPYQQQGPHPQHPHPGAQYPYQRDPYGTMGSPGRPYPSQEPDQPFSNEIQENSEQPERKQSNGYRKPPKPKQNFIDINKTSAKLRRDPPNKKYTEALGQKKGFKSPMNPRKPLPNISRENSLDDGQASSTGWTPHGSATSRSNDQWARAVFREQQMIMLARGMSDPSIYPPGPQPPMRNSSVPGHFAGGSPYQGGYPTPDANFNQINGQPYSWSADRAKAYARMNAMQNANQPPMGGPYDSIDPRGSFDMNQTSPRQRMAYTHPMPSGTSPFQVLPDIHGSGRKSSDDNELRTSDPDGYLVKLQKQKQGPQYKPYTLKDFQNLKKDFKLGGLGPDKETMGIRNDKAARQREYARQVMEQNKKTIKPNPKARTPGKESPQTEASKRELNNSFPYGSFR